MRRLLCAVCLTLLLSGTASAAGVNGVEVQALLKTGSSWDGKALPDWVVGRPEITVLRITIPPGRNCRSINIP